MAATTAPSVVETKNQRLHSTISKSSRAVTRFENPGGGHVVLGGDNVPFLVKIGFKNAVPLATGLLCIKSLIFKKRKYEIFENYSQC